jgi:ABC-type nickel/cobalt efflux system permease component RcnA
MFEILKDLISNSFDRKINHAEKRISTVIIFSFLASIVSGFILYLLGDVMYLYLQDSGFSESQSKLILIAISALILAIIAYRFKRMNNNEEVKIKNKLSKSEKQIDKYKIDTDEVIEEFLKGFNS